MKLMAIDCEMNQPSNKVIQIGAVIFDADTCTLIDSLRIYVDPHEPLSDEIIKLTRITQAQVDGTAPISSAYRQLMCWAAKHKVFRNPVVWGSGEGNDSTAIYDQVCKEDPTFKDENFMGHRVIDVKTLCQVRSIVQHGDVAGGLQVYLHRMGLRWDARFGEPHDALADALNTMHSFAVYSAFFQELSYLERYAQQSEKPDNKGKWQGVISKLQDDADSLVKILNKLVGLKEHLKNQP
jgi:inhibitor of KinA sporulation pathway (predicted exonuclease)